MNLHSHEGAFNFRSGAKIPGLSQYHKCKPDYTISVKNWLGRREKILISFASGCIIGFILRGWL